MIGFSSDKLKLLTNYFSFAKMLLTRVQIAFATYRLYQTFSSFFPPYI